MRPRLIAILLLIVLLPLAALAWLGVRVAHNEREIVQHRFQELLLGSLKDIDANIAKLLQERERELLRVTDVGTYDTAAVRALVRQNPPIQQMVVLGADGERIHPPPAGTLSESETEFVARNARLWTGPQRLSRKGLNTSASDGLATATGEFHGWFADRSPTGIQLVFWHRNALGGMVAVEVNRARLLSDIVGALPASEPFRPESPRGRITLVDSQDKVLYQWGGYDPPEGASPRAGLALSHPLDAWSLQYYVSSIALDKALGRGALLSTIWGLVSAGIVLGGLAVYFYRESSRHIREASQRVSFANQVSHELKTPLTNIRMYAEMLESSLTEEDNKARRHLGVIVSESQRLSRLIGNVLTFARKQRNGLKLRMAPGNVDDLTRSVLDHSRLSFGARRIDVEFSAAASATVRFDADAVEQILGNLLGNVEKYAAFGRVARVSSRQEGDKTVITVSDKGPGIPSSHRKKVFEPFYRRSDKLTDGVAGTGIGLSIARDLARLHGGDLTLIPTEVGACFEVVLHTPRTTTEEQHEGSDC